MLSVHCDEQILFKLFSPFLQFSAVSILCIGLSNLLFLLQSDSKIRIEQIIYMKRAISIDDGSVVVKQRYKSTPR